MNIQNFGKIYGEFSDSDEGACHCDPYAIFDYCFTGEIVSRYTNMNHNDVTLHPFGTSRLHRMLERLRQVRLRNDTFPWTRIQYARPQVQEEALFESGNLIEPKSVPFYSSLAPPASVRLRNIVSERAPHMNLTIEYIAIWRFYLESFVVTYARWNPETLDELIKPQEPSWDALHFDGFTKLLLDNTLKNISKGSSSQQTRFIDPESHALVRLGHFSGDGCAYSRRIRYKKASGSIATLHCNRHEQFGVCFGANSCRAAANVHPEQAKPYEGKDPNPTTIRYCNMCHRPESSEQKLKKCTRCKLVTYCSRDCQKEDFDQHKTACKDIKKEMDRLNKLSDHIAARPHVYDVAIDPFESAIGRFEDHPGLAFYIACRFSVSRKIFDLVLSSDNTEVLEECLSHFLEILRLGCPTDIAPLVKGYVAIILLYLNRDDDCFSFIRHCLLRMNFNPEVVRASKPGDWMYPKENGCRFDRVADILQATEGRPFDNEDLRYLAPLFLALITIKLRIRDHHRSRKKSFEIFEGTRFAERAKEAVPVIRDLVIGDEGEERRLDAARDDLQDLVLALHGKNTFVLGALEDPNCYPLRMRGGVIPTDMYII